MLLSATVEPRQSHRRKRHQLLIILIKVLAVSFYLISWVANGEILQSVSSLYDRPAAITWFSYNFMCFSLLFWVAIAMPFDGDNKNPTAALEHAMEKKRGTKRRRRRRRQQWWNTARWKVRLQEWAGTFGIVRAVGLCLLISYLLLALNILMVLGLQCISVSLSNAIYQLQTPLTILLSMIWLQEQFHTVQGLGMVLSLLGVAWIVLPPLHGNSGGGGGDSCLIRGAWQTVVSAMIGGVYLTSWKWFDRKNATKELSAIEGFWDAQMTLGMIGLCNLVAGWPVLVALHYSGMERLEWPVDGLVWRWLLINGIVEYIFDASCAVAIYVTSPVVVSVTAPLTIPLSIAFDKMLQREESGMSLNWSLFLGGVFVLVGTWLIEVNPPIRGVYWRTNRFDSEKVKQEDLETIAMTV